VGAALQPPASKLPEDEKGYGYIRESGNARKFRAFWVPDVHIKDMASRAFEPGDVWAIGAPRVLELTADSQVFPDGAEIPMNRQKLWDAVTDDPQTVKEIADSADVTTVTAKKVLDQWVSQKYVKPGKRANATTYYR